MREHARTVAMADDERVRRLCALGQVTTFGTFPVSLNVG